MRCWDATPGQLHARPYLLYYCLAPWADKTFFKESFCQGIITSFPFLESGNTPKAPGSKHSVTHVVTGLACGYIGDRFGSRGPLSTSKAPSRVPVTHIQEVIDTRQ